MVTKTSTPASEPWPTPIDPVTGQPPPGWVPPPSSDLLPQGPGVPATGAGTSAVAGEKPPVTPESLPSVSGIVAEINAPTASGELKVPTVNDAVVARNKQIAAGGDQPPLTVDRWNQLLLADFNARVETPTFAEGYVPGQPGKLRVPAPVKAAAGRMAPVGKVEVRMTRLPLTPEQQYVHFLSTGQILPESVLVLNMAGDPYFIPAGTEKDVEEQSARIIQLASQVTAGVAREAEKIVKAAETSKKELAEQIAKFEKEVLPDLSDDLRAAYVEGKKVGDFTKFNTAVADAEKQAREALQKAEKEYKAWASQFTKAELQEIQSGRYVVRDPATGQEIKTTKRAKEEFEVQELQIAKQNSALSSLRQAGFGVEVGKLEPGEMGPELPEDMRWEYDLVGAAMSGFDKDTALDAFPENKEVVDKAYSTATAMKKLEAAGGSPAWALLNNRITKDELRLILGDEATQYITDFDRRNAAVKTLREAKITDQGNRIAASFILGQYLLSAGAEKAVADVSDLTDKAKNLVESIPRGSAGDAVKQEMLKVPLGLLTGVAMSMAGGFSVLSFIAGLPVHATTPDYTKNFQNKLTKAFMDIPISVVADPVWGVSQTIGFFLGPAGVYKMAHNVASKGSPWYIPNTAARFTFSTGKLPVSYGVISKLIKEGRITEVEVARAISRVTNRAMQSPTAKATAQIGRTNVRVFIEPTPAAKWMGSALWRGVPVREAYSKLEHVVSVKGKEPAEFYSLHAAPRFALTSAGGTPATAPALIMVYTKAGKLTAYPTSVQRASTLSSMSRAGFEYLGSGRAKPGAYGPIKTFAGRFELEAMLPNNMIINRVQNFRSRILGAAAGEFVTTLDGWVMPIYRFAERGATVPTVGIAELAAIRVYSVLHGIRAMTGKKGFGSEAGYASIRMLTRQFDAAGRAATTGLRGAAAATAYQRAVDAAMVKTLERMYRDADMDGLERFWKKRSDIFEREYLRTIYSSLAAAGRVRTDPRAYRDGTSYATVRVTADRARVAERARELDRAVIRRIISRPARVTASVREVRPPIRRTGVPERPPIRRTVRRTGVPERPPIRRTGVPERPPIRPRTPTPTRPTVTTPPAKKVPVLPALPDSGLGRKQPRIPLGSITWAQGLFWKYIPPPWNQRKPITLKEPPVGAKNAYSNIPAETIQMIGESESPVPDTVSIDLGIADIFISGGGRKIEFTGKGIQTDIGERIPGTVVGMSIPGKRRPRVTYSVGKKKVRPGAGFGEAGTRESMNEALSEITGL